jgi:phosphoglycolate phosphatase-like HAD superfamily hydrolase
VIQTRHESPSPKPYPEGLLHILNRLNVSAENALYVGDARIDGVAAKRAGIEFWGVATGETNADILHSVEASHVFNSLSELLDRLELRISE